MASKAPTLRDLAAATGVHLSTVSRAMKIRRPPMARARLAASKFGLPATDASSWMIFGALKGFSSGVCKWCKRSHCEKINIGRKTN